MERLQAISSWLVDKWVVFLAILAAVEIVPAYFQGDGIFWQFVVILFYLNRRWDE